MWRLISWLVRTLIDFLVFPFSLKRLEVDYDLGFVVLAVKIYLGIFFLSFYRV